MNDLISIVIPIYKVENFLSRCLDSVLQQTYSNLEIILVDDGSPDKCGEICEKYAEKDNRITVIHKQNGGLSSARNVGIEIAKGKYISFIDSDDMVSNDFIKNLYTNIIKSDSQISICGYKFINESEIPKYQELTKEKTKVYSSRTALKKMLYQKQINNSAWGKLYLKSLFNTIRYPEGKIYEDILVTYKTFQKSNKICISSKKNYYYTKRNESISSTFNEKTFDIISNVQIMADDLKQDSFYRKAVNSRVLNADFFVIRQINEKEHFDMYQKLYKDIKKRRLTVLLDLNTRLKTKIGILISFFGIEMIKKIYSNSKELNIIKKLD